MEKKTKKQNHATSLVLIPASAPGSIQGSLCDADRIHSLTATEGRATWRRTFLICRSDLNETLRSFDEERGLVGSDLQLFEQRRWPSASGVEIKV